MENQFDEKNCSLIGAFLELKDRCYSWEKSFLGEAFYNTNRNKFDFICYTSFYSGFRDVCDLPLFFLINEEISNSHERNLFPPLMEQVFKNDRFVSGTCEQGDEWPLRAVRHRQDLENLLVFQYNEVFASSLLDFIVSAFSVFEYWIDRLYTTVCKDHENRVLESRIAGISKELKKYAASPTEDALKTIAQKILSKTGKFISFPDKINGICEHIDKNKYQRDLKKDLEIVSFISRQRNTVHNLGTHRGADVRIILDGVEHFLEKGKPQKSESWVHTLGLVGQLIEIYTAILLSLNERENFLSGFVDGRVDFLKIEILTQTMNDFLYQDLTGDELIRTRGNYAEFLCKKFGFSVSQSDVFIDNLLNLNRRELSQIDTYGLLAIANLRSGTDRGA